MDYAMFWLSGIGFGWFLCELWRRGSTKERE